MLQEILIDKKISVWMKREDLLHPSLGNKFYKLKYNLIEATNQGHDTILTFGGAFSNHIAAVAAIGEQTGFHTIGVIRGDELTAENPTLKQAAKNGMRFHFVSRETYKHKEDVSFLMKLESLFGRFYSLPEGGTNTLAVKGCNEILTPDTADFDYICCAVGTGGTLLGLIESSAEHQKIIGFPAVKDSSLNSKIESYTEKRNWLLNWDYSFGGYGKIDEELISFMNRFYLKTGIPTDPVYTSKLLFGVMDLIKKNQFEKGSRILLIHTGGLQGIDGMNNRLRKLKLPTIDYV